MVQKNHKFIFFLQAMVEILLLFTMECSLPRTDSDNDKWSKNCASSWKGAWWYKDCYNSNLNALYLYSKSSTQGMAWMKWKNNYFSFKRSEMKTRPKIF